MGNEGGTIVKRKDLLALHALNNELNERVGDDTEQVLLQSCALSGLPLYQNAPIVGDYKGKLYIKEKILQYILDAKLGKINIKSQFLHLKSLKDLCTVTITWKVVNDIPHFMCPVTRELDNKAATYSYLRPCGCVMSSKVLREIKKATPKVSATAPDETKGTNEAGTINAVGAMEVKEIKEEKAETAFKDDTDHVCANCPVCNKSFVFDYDMVMINPIDKKSIIEFNDETYTYLRDVLKQSNSKQPLKKKKSKALSSPSSTFPVSATNDLIRKRKPDADDKPETPKRVRA